MRIRGGSFVAEMSLEFLIRMQLRGHTRVWMLLKARDIFTKRYFLSQVDRILHFDRSLYTVTLFNPFQDGCIRTFRHVHHS